ncbi:MAG TPA: L-fucokinase [bacterium]|nr:L-fucokinase [bacterium]
MRQRRGIIPEESVVLAVPDPASVRVGSGGATLNALVSIAEHLSARAGYTVINPDVLRSSRILVLHSGGDSRRIPHCSVRGKAFCSLPAINGDGELCTPVDMLLQTLSCLCADSPPGLFVASSDVMLSLPPKALDWSQAGVTGVAVQADMAYGPKHGVYKLDPKTSAVEAFFQKESLQALEHHGAIRANQTVLLDSGIVYFCCETSEALLNFHVTPPLDACTYLGVDNGAVPLRFELYSDVLSCMAKNTLYEEYLEMPTQDPHPNTVRRARDLLWKKLHFTPFRALVVESAQFVHLGTTAEYVSFLNSDRPVRETFSLVCHAQFHIDHPESADKAILTNALLLGEGHAEPEAIIENSELQGDWTVGRRAICSEIRSFSGVQVEEDVVIQEIPIRSTQNGGNMCVITLLGIDDDTTVPFSHPGSTFLNRPWACLFEQAEISPDEIWFDLEQEKRTLWNAKLYPIHVGQVTPEIVLWLQYLNQPPIPILRRWKNAHRVSFADILQIADPEEEFLCQRQLSFKIDLLKIRSTLLNQDNECLLPLFRRCIREDRIDVLQTLDEIASEAPVDIAARTFANIADVLAGFAGTKGGLRSGPSRNPAWQQAFDLLDQGDLRAATVVLAREREKWLKDPEFLIRAARHYEGAAQVLIRKSVESAEIHVEECDPAPMGVWMTAEAPARIDLAGGWTDTPPITFEHGGVVVNMAIEVDGQRPVGACVRRIEEPILLLTQNDMENPVICKSVSDLQDFAQPFAPGALVKAALLCAGVVSLSTSQSLRKQLERFGGGLEIHTWSNLPTGSGLGTSSILAGALFSSIGAAVGMRYDTPSLIHAVLRTEQMLTTGGGWQDQVGGLLPGIKISRCPPGIPIKLESCIVDIPNNFLDALNRHLVLVYTGRTRLARNLLQDVIRRWYARLPETVHLTDALTENAEHMYKALLDGDLEEMGRVLTVYYYQKKQMAGGVEPMIVSHMAEILRPYVFGSSLAGAGGGGFMLLVTKKTNAAPEIRAILESKTDIHALSFHDIKVDNRGLVIHAGSKSN